MSDVTDAPAAREGQAAPRSDQGGFIWYELMTTEVTAAGAFYSEVVKGWSFGERVPADVDYRMIQRSDGGNAGGVLGLNGEMIAGGARPVWLGYLHARDVDASFAAIKAAGGQTMREPWDQPGVGRLAMVTDPQGAPFYLMDPIPPENDPNAVSDVFSVEKPEHVRWNELSTSDPDSAVDFYSRNFGWTQEGAMDMGDYGEYRFVQKGGVGIGAIMARMPDMPVTLWTFYIGVDDIDRAAKAITDNGGSILNGPMEIPGGEFALNGMDPQGASFGLVGPRKIQ
ncbi:MAG TPA: VOC family protein [Sphingomicrobium sp.]|nr:VOC family protein [Sphingomicrobium sp.]